MRQGVGLAVTRGVLVLAAAIAGSALSGAAPPRMVSAGALDFVEVAAGPFMMGAGLDRDAEALDNERWSASAGEGPVDLPAFLISRTETTAADFAAFVQATQRPVDRRALDLPPRHPAAFVSWPDAVAYCRWLETALQTAPGLPAAVADRLRAGWRVRLPSEAQWEKAARGTDGRRFPWGAAPRRDRANYEGGGPMPVGAFACPECPHGLRDMSGNVWEWTSSPYQPYPYSDADDRATLDADALWVIRGGHYGDTPRMIRTTARGAAEPGARRPFIGFRVALVPPR